MPSFHIVLLLCIGSRCRKINIFCFSCVYMISYCFDRCNDVRRNHIIGIPYNFFAIPPLFCVKASFQSVTIIISCSSFRNFFISFMIFGIAALCGYSSSFSFALLTNVVLSLLFLLYLLCLHQIVYTKL